MVGGEHVLYTWWNLVVMWFCGAEYYVPVIANVVFTFCAAHLLAEMAKELQFPAGYSRLLQVFYLLHWDTIAWSSLVNIKDVLVQLMTIAFFYFAIRVLRRREKGSLAICGILFLAFLRLRFYVPFVIGAATAAWVFLQWRDFRKYPLLAGGLVLGLWLLPAKARPFWESISYFDAAYGMFRFMLTPRPWEIVVSHSFLFLPSTMHWVMILPAMAGGVMLWQDSRTARLVLLYSAVLIFLYGMAEEIQGSRQRCQLSYVFAWMQMHFLWRWIHTPAHRSASIAKPRIEPRPSAARAA
jgi:hypothetical protein